MRSPWFDYQQRICHALCLWVGFLRPKTIMTFYFSLRSLCRQLKNTPHFFSEYIFNSHYMFRHSGPDHMLLHTVLEQKDARLNLTFTCESKSKIQDKQKFTKILSWKKLIPSGATRLPPQLSLSSTVLMAPPCRDFSPSLQTLHPLR